MTVIVKITVGWELMLLCFSGSVSTFQVNLLP